MKGCSVTGCTAVHYARGYCRTHYDKWRRRGDATAPPIPGPVDRFWAKVDKSGECWEWTASRAGGGYGSFTVNGRGQPAHKFAYELLAGPVPAGLVLDHLCRNRICVRPDHLEPVTERENILRGESEPAKNARKTHCHKGHKFTPETTYIYAASGFRMCRLCRREWEQARRSA